VPKIPFFLSKVLAIDFSNFLRHKKPNEHPLRCLAEHSTWNKCPIHPWLLFLASLHGIFTRAIIKPFPSGDTILGVQSHIYLGNLLKKAYYLWSFIK